MKTLRLLAAAAYAAFLAPTALAGPAITWLSSVHDFGAFDEDDGIVSCEIPYVNSGDSPLLLTGARASCGCTTPQISREPLAPGDTAAIVVSFDPTGRPGRFSKKIRISSNTEPATSTLEVKGVVVGSASTVGQRFPVDFGTLKLRTGAVMAGEVTKGKTQTVFVDGYNRSAHEVRPRVGNLPPYIGANTAPETVGPGEQFSLVFYFHSDRCPLYGLVSSTVTLDAGDGSEPRELPVVAMVKEDFSKLSDAARAKAPVIRPETDRLDFGRLDRHQSEKTSRSITLRNDGRSPLLIRRVYSGDKGIEASVSSEKIKAGKTAVLTLNVDPSQLPGDILNARVQVISNDPSAPVVTIRAVGELK
jgi:hypothetical protein